VAGDHADAARAALGKDGDVRAVRAGEGPSALADAQRVPAEVLVADVDTGPGLGQALLRYRLARQETRVVLLAVGRKPGDADVAAAVQAGVYDVVTDVTDLPSAVTGAPAGIAAAARWLDPTLAPGATAEPAVRVETHFAPSTSHPVFVAVQGICGGAGATTVAASLAGFLGHLRGHRVLYAEAGNLPAPALAFALQDRTRAGAVDLHQATQGNLCRVLSERRWHYVVVDGTPQTTLPTQPDLTIRVAPAAVHRLGHLVAPLRSQQEAQATEVWVLSGPRPDRHALDAVAESVAGDVFLWPDLTGIDIEGLLRDPHPATAKSARRVLRGLLPEGR